MNALATTRVRCLLLGLASLSIVSPSVADERTGPAERAASYLEREDVRRWIDETSEARDLDRDRVAALFAELRPYQSVLDAIATPAERRLRWHEYRPIFLGEERIDAGRAFLREHAATLARAEQRYGVPARVIVAIIGVETLYGRITGRHGVLESLVTLAFDYPPRAAFFGAELAEFLVLAEAEGWDAGAIKGSYAGAMGLPQFIASSYRHYAIDFDGDGRRDLFGSTADAIGSVANYLAEHGWRRGEPVVTRWEPEASRREAARALVGEGLKPDVAAGTLRELGFEPVTSDASSGGDAVERPLSVMTFATGGGEELWVGYTNFYMITRYNHSRLYALAVHQLAEAIGETP